MRKSQVVFAGTNLVTFVKKLKYKTIKMQTRPEKYSSSHRLAKIFLMPFEIVSGGGKGGKVPKPGAKDECMC